MTRKKKIAVRLSAILLAILMPTFTGIIATAGAEEVTGNTGNSVQGKYEKADINGNNEPEDLSVSANTEYMEKAWYEYVTYSDKAVASYRLDDDTRLLFYDPYTYTNAMVMDVQFDATTTEFDTMSSYTISKTTTKSIEACISSTDTSTSATQTSGHDEFGSTVTNAGEQITTYNHNVSTKTSGKVEDSTEYKYDAHETLSWTLSEAAQIKANALDSSVTITNSNTVGMQWLTDEVTNTTTYSDDYKTTTTYSGESTVEDKTTSSTEGWTELSDRITKTLSSSSSTSTSWSESEGVTVTKTYLATHFASDGITPLPWAIVHYEVQMPMRVCMQVKHSGEWVTMSEIYCMLTTVKGTCRAWMQNGQVYYEDWGNGEPVVATDFWSQFMTKEQLINAYSNKPYPVGGVN